MHFSSFLVSYKDYFMQVNGFRPVSNRSVCAAGSRELFCVIGGVL